jgi:hypothetical protein
VKSLSSSSSDDPNASFNNLFDKWIFFGEILGTKRMDFEAGIGFNKIRAHFAVVIQQFPKADGDAVLVVLNP